MSNEFTRFITARDMNFPEPAHIVIDPGCYCRTIRLTSATPKIMEVLAIDVWEKRAAQNQLQFNLFRSAGEKVIHLAL